MHIVFVQYKTDYMTGGCRSNILTQREYVYKLNKLIIHENFLKQVVGSGSDEMYVFQYQMKSK